MSFLVAAINFFGLHPGQSKIAFGKELLALPHDFRLEIHERLQRDSAEPIDPPAAPKID
jgi:hypothetical protein